MSRWWQSKEKDETPSPKQATVATESGETKVGFLEANKKFFLLIAGCVVIMCVARYWAVRNKADAERQKELKQQQAQQFQMGDDTSRASTQKFYDGQTGKGLPGQATSAPVLQVPGPQFTSEQLKAMGVGTPLPSGDATNPSIPSGALPAGSSVPAGQSGNSTPTEKPVPVALIVSHRGQTSAAAPETPIATPMPPATGGAWGPIASPAPFPGSETAPLEAQAHHELNGNPIVDRNRQNPEDALHDLHAATGERYRIREGMVLPCTEQLRAVSNYASNLNCFIGIDVYSTDGQRLLIKQGSVAIGHAAAISSIQQRRLFVVWEKIIMPDGYTLDYSNSPGLDQSGATGVTGKMDNHFLEVFGVGIGVAALSAAGQVGNFSSSAITVGSQLRSGITNGAADTGSQILNRYLPLPTMTYKEGSQGNVYVAYNWWVPEYKNHTMKAGL